MDRELRISLDEEDEEDDDDVEPEVTDAVAERNPLESVCEVHKKFAKSRLKHYLCLVSYT